jgi:signal transduction histidine kinase
VRIADLSGELPADHALQRLGVSGPALLVPVETSRGVIGVLAIINADPDRRFASGVAALEHFARQSALAVEYGQARDELQRLAVLEDRARIARELHDGVIQSLFGAGMLLEATVETEKLGTGAGGGLARVAEMIDRTILDLRSYIFDLEPLSLAGRSLEEALRMVAREMEASSSIQCVVTTQRLALEALEPLVTPIIQIVREALSNIVRHALATSCRIELGQDAGGVFLQVTDDGRGFSPAEVTWGNGLGNIARRALGIGARAEFLSEPGAGSTIRIRFPLSATG